MLKSRITIVKTVKVDSLQELCCDNVNVYILFALVNNGLILGTKS